MNYLPSRKILSLLVLAVGIVLGIMFAFNRKATESATLGLANITAGEKIQIPDNPNWQTDFSQIANETEVNPTELAETEDSVTDNFSVSLMSTYLDLKQSGNLNDQTAQSLIDNSLQYFDSAFQSNLENPKFNIIQDNSKQAIASYGENLGNIFLANLPAEPKNELEILTEIATTQNKSRIKEIEEINLVYQKIETDLLKMNVPSIFARSHNDIILGLRGIQAGIKEMQNVLHDPVKSLASVKIYEEGFGLFQQSFVATKNFITKQNIFYKQGSGGYYLLRGL